MEYMEFVNRVRRDLRFEMIVDAQRAVEASLSTFGERLTSTQVHRFGSQLPEQLKGYLVQRPDVEGFTLEEYYNRAAARMGVSYSEGVRRSRTVMVLLKDLLSEGALHRILQELPGEYRELFGWAPGGPLSPSAPGA